MNSIKQHSQVSYVQFDSARQKYLQLSIALKDETIWNDFGGLACFRAERVQNDSLQTWQKIQGSAVTRGVTDCTVNKTPAQ
jgi:hypothetical protein